MNKVDTILEIEHRYGTRPHRGRIRPDDYDGPVELSIFMPKNAKMVEVGSHIGESTLAFLMSKKFELILAVDPYLDMDDREIPGQNYRDMQNVYSWFKDNVIEGSNGVVSLLRMKSIDASSLILDRSLDLVYIDGLHGYNDVLADIRAWIGKVKPGGVIAGHDYTSQHEGFGVIQAVDEMFGSPDHVFADTSWMKRVP